MTIMRYIGKLVILVISFNVLATDASEDIEIGTVEIITGDYPPYYSASLPGDGPVAENIMLACKKANLDCNIQFLPWNRVYFTLEAGEADMAFAIHKTDERLRKYIYSREALHSISDSVFFLRSKFPDGIHFADYKDLAPYTLLGDDPSWYAENLKKFGVNTIWILTNADKWKMLLFGRGDALISDTYQGLFELRQKEQESDEFVGKIGFTERSYAADFDSHDYIIYSRPHFDKRRQLIRDSIDKALKKIDSKTAVANILDEQYSGDTHHVQ